MAFEQEIQGPCTAILWNKRPNTAVTYGTVGCPACSCYGRRTWVTSFFFVVFLHHCLTLAVVVTPPLLIAGASGANLSNNDISYLVSASLILSGIFSIFQIVRFRIFNTGLWIGTGMLSVVGEAFSAVPIAQGFFATEYAAGRCPTSPDGKKLPCREAYGKFLGTVSCVMLFQVALSLVKPRILMRIFPKLVSGLVLVCIGASLAASGMKSWAGGTGPCMARPKTGPFINCPNNSMFCLPAISSTAYNV